ncbi:hypothetical protein BDR07DRAFT_1428556 [Suillus spraguei]|nr:hypothetical protein BDR07DRAFT_1428556 [Suillus spraguei]
MYLRHALCLALAPSKKSLCCSISSNLIPKGPGPLDAEGLCSLEPDIAASPESIENVDPQVPALSLIQIPEIVCTLPKAFGGLALHICTAAALLASLTPIAI